MKQQALIWTFALLTIGCGQRALPPSEYVSWAEQEDNGLRVTRKLGDFEFVAQYKPVDYVIAQEEKSNEIPESVYNKRKGELEGYVYMNLVIRSADARTPVLQNRTTPEGYYQRINYFVSEAQDDFHIQTVSDTMDCTLCHFEQNYGLAPENTVVLVFKPRKPLQPKEDMILVYDDQVLNVGQVKLKITADALDDVPRMLLD